VKRCRSGRAKQSLSDDRNGSGLCRYKNSWDGRFPVETMLIEELIPHIDHTYPTIAGVHLCATA
jgi:hypothetical protein